MEVIFDEISQYIIKEVDKVSYNHHLQKNSKYIACIYNYDNKLMMCLYLGFFDSKIFSEGYRFKNNSHVSNEFFIINTNHDYHNDCLTKFFEVEEIFDFDVLDNIYVWFINNIKFNSFNSPESNNIIFSKKIFDDNYIIVSIYEISYKTFHNIIINSKWGY